MSGGTGSTLVLRPTGLTAITFDLDANNMAAGSYVVDLDTLRLGEESREIVEYAQRVGAEGGDVVGVQNPLVPLSFEVVVCDSTRAGTIQMVHDLRVALQAGGMLEYKPEDLPGGVTSSYYVYLRSGPGGLKKARNNRWDRVASDSGGTDVFYTTHLVSLMTYPLLTADPSSPITAVAATTVENRDDATGDNFVTIPAAALDGDSRALLQITMRNLETGSNDEVVGVYIFPRIDGLTNYKITFEPGTIVVGATEWATINDPGQASGGSYQRLTPTSDDIAYRLRFQVTNWADFIGRHLLMIACRDNGGTVGDYEVRGGWSLGAGEVLDPTPWRSTRLEWLGEWQLFALGEMEFLGTQVVGVESASTPYYELEVRRVSGGSGTFEVDFFIAGPVDLRPLYVDCTDFPVSNDERLLVSNLEYPVQVVHTVAQATLALVGPVKPLGLLPLASCGREATDGYRLYFLWERLSGTLAVDDDFSGYDANWTDIDDCDTTWINAADDADDKVEGTASQEDISPTDPVVGHSANYSGIPDADYFCCMSKVSSGAYDVYFDFITSLVPLRYYRHTQNIGAAWEPVLGTKGGFAAVNGPNWGTVARLRVDNANTWGNADLNWDSWRWSAKDPDAVQPNDFGSDWNYQPAGYPWFVFSDASPRCAANPVPVGAEGSGGTAEQTLVSNMANADNVTVKARCYVFSSTLVGGGKIGIIFRVSDQTSGSEDCYALIIDSDANTLTLYEYTAGTATSLGSVGFTVNEDTWYWLGVTCREGAINCYANVSEGALWDSILIGVDDGTHTTGKCGFIVVDGMGRFDDVEVWVEDDRYDPQDDMSVEVKALLRSVHPHCE